MHVTFVGSHTPTHSPPEHTWSLQNFGVAHWPVASHVSATLPSHRFDPGAHAPVHAPPAQTWPTHAATVWRRPSASHPIAVSESMHVDPPGSVPAQYGSSGTHVPWLTPGVVSHASSIPQVRAASHTPAALQMRDAVCACPAHASSPMRGHAHPTEAIAEGSRGHWGAAPGTPPSTSPEGDALAGVAWVGAALEHASERVETAKARRAWSPGRPVWASRMGDE
jgi:hypothetical protein